MKRVISISIIILLVMAILAGIAGCNPTYTEVEDYLLINGKFFQSQYTGLIFGICKVAYDSYRWALTSPTGIEMANGGPLNTQQALDLINKYQMIGFNYVSPTMIDPYTWTAIVTTIVSRIPVGFWFVIFAPTLYKAQPTVPALLNSYPAP